MTLWQHIKEDGGFGLFDYIGSRVAFTAAQWERWYAMPVCMLVGALLTLVAIPVTFAWLLAHLCICAYRRACEFGRSLHERDRPGVAHFIGLLLGAMVGLLIARCSG